MFRFDVSVDITDIQLKEFSWKGCPEGLEKIYLDFNELKDFSWEGCPECLEKISLSDNYIKELSFEGCPVSLKECIGYDDEFKKYRASNETINNNLMSTMKTILQKMYK